MRFTGLKSVLKSRAQFFLNNNNIIIKIRDENRVGNRSIGAQQIYILEKKTIAHAKNIN